MYGRVHWDIWNFQKDFLAKLPIYANFIERNNIELGILLCSELYDSPLDGITYKESKEFSNVLDVIELDRKRDNDGDNDGEDDDAQCAAVNHHDPLGYDEVLQTIRAIIWSNVDMKKKTPLSKVTHTDQPTANADSDEEKDDYEASTFEAEMSGFEQLLTEVMNFKEATASWSRNERLLYAEKFAGKWNWTNLKIYSSILIVFFHSLFLAAFDNLVQHKTLDGQSDSDDDIGK